MDLFNISMKDIAGIAERNQADDIFDVPLVDPAMAEINAKLDKIIALLERPKKTCVRAASRYTPEFEELWALYPKRQGSNPKRAAYHAVRARLKDGETLSVIREGVVAYRAYCDAKGDTGGEFVMQAVRFFGTSQEYLAEWIAPAPKAALPRSDSEWLALGRQKGIDPRVGESFRDFNDRVRAAL